MLFLVNLKKEAKRTVKELITETEEIRNLKKKIDAAKILGSIKRISYNIRSMIDLFVKEFVAYDGIKEIMDLIEVSEEIANNDIIATSC